MEWFDQTDNRKGRKTKTSEQQFNKNLRNHQEIESLASKPVQI